MKLLLWLTGSSVILIVCAIITILYYNSFTEKIISPIVSIICVAVVTALITSLFQLKDFSGETSFVTSVITYQDTKMPATIFNRSKQFFKKRDDVNDIFLERQEEMPFLSQTVEKTIKRTFMAEGDTNYIAHDITRECIQYQIIQYLAELANLKSARFKKDTLEYRTTFTLTDNTIYQGSSFETELKKNHLYFYDGDKFENLIQQQYSFPTDTKLLVDNKYWVHNKDEREHKLTLTRKNYFTFEVIIKDFYGQVPTIADITKLDISDEGKKHFGTSYYEVTMRYSFPKLTSLSNEQDEYRKWVERLTKELSSRFGDYFDSRM